MWSKEEAGASGPQQIGHR